MTNEFAVIGHHRDDEVETLLLLGADRHYYRYDLTDNRLEAPGCIAASPPSPPPGST